MFHGKHRGLSRAEAMLEYLKVAQDLETYGITYYDITNKKGSELVLGVDALGLNVYDKADRLSPKISFPWSEINRISYQSDNFIVKLNDKKSPKFVGVCLQNKQSKRVYDVASGNHEMYIRRRRPDTLEVQQMRSQKKDEDISRAKEKEGLAREQQARARAEQERKDMEERYEAMEVRIKKREKELEEAQESISRLEDQLKGLQDAKDELEKQQEELKEMMIQLEEAKNLEAEERANMEDEIREKQEEIQEIRGMVANKEEETKQLQEEVEESKMKLEETANNLASTRAAVEEARKAVSYSSAESTTSEEKEETGSNAPLDIPEIVVDDMEDRQIGLGEEMVAELEMLGEDLKDKRDSQNETDETKTYRETLLLSGTDKYKTLREVRSGNTKRRIDNFENM